MHLFCEAHLLHHFEFHIYYFERFPIFQGNDKSRRVDLIFISSKSWNSNILLNMVILFLLFMKVVMLSALVKEVRKEGSQRRYEVIKITNVIIMFTIDSKKRKFRNVQDNRRIKFYYFSELYHNSPKPGPMFDVK